VLKRSKHIVIGPQKQLMVYFSSLTVSGTFIVASVVKIVAPVVVFLKKYEVTLNFLRNLEQSCFYYSFQMIVKNKIKCSFKTFHNDIQV
jgi:hypothetical protein